MENHFKDMNYTIITPCGIKTNWNDWNDIQNRFNGKSYVPTRNPPKKLLANVIREFEEFCKTWHIDVTAYQFVEPCEFDGQWKQFDFKDSPDSDTGIQCHSIIANKNGRIFQRIFDLGH